MLCNHVNKSFHVHAYIIKEDEFPIDNCKESELAFNYWAKAQASRTPTFRYGDPFVLEHYNRVRLDTKIAS